MKKKVILIAICIMLVVMLLTIATFLLERYYEPVAVLENISYGMSPHMISKRFGVAQEKYISGEETWMWYQYPAVIEDKNVVITFGFFRNLTGWQLFSVQIEYSNTGSCVEKDIFVQLMLSKFREAYSDNENYYEVREQGQVNVGLNYGATGVSCTIKQADNGVTVQCQRVA